MTHAGARESVRLSVAAAIATLRDSRRAWRHDRNSMSLTPLSPDAVCAGVSNAAGHSVRGGLGHHRTPALSHIRTHLFCRGACLAPTMAMVWRTGVGSIAVRGSIWCRNIAVAIPTPPVELRLCDRRRTIIQHPDSFPDRVHNSLSHAEMAFAHDCLASLSHSRVSAGQ